MRYKQFNQLCINEVVFVPLLKAFSTGSNTGLNLRILLLHCLIMNDSKLNEAELMLGATDDIKRPH